jgi:hypothetical protein
MNCKEVKKFLVDFIDGSLDENLKMSLQEHLKTCKVCAAELVELKNYFNDAGSMSKIPAPDDFLEKLHERLESVNRFKKILRALFTPIQIKIPLEAAGVVAVAAAVVFFLRGSPLQTVEQITMVSPKSEPAQVEQKPKEKHLDIDTPLEAHELDTEEKDEIDIPETRVKSSAPAEEEAGGIALTETGETESVMEEIADRSELEETTDAGLAVRKQKEDEGPVEIALLIKSSAADEPDVSVTARKKAVDAELSEKSIQDDELTAGTRSMAPDKNAEEPQPLPTLDNVLSVLKGLTLKMGGNIISVEYETQTNRSRLITVEIPTENYTLFLAELYLLGQLSEEPPSTYAQENEFVSLEIELITSF